MIKGVLIAWLLKKQTITAQSTYEAEYEALCQLTKSAQWLQCLFHEIFSTEPAVVVTQIDNTAAMITANSNKISSKNRHFLMHMATVREAIKAGTIQLQYMPSDEVIADGFTKGLSSLQHAEFCRMLNIK